jgi:hypothetical protein
MRSVPSTWQKIWCTGMGSAMTQNDQRPERKGLGLKRQIDENLKRVYQDALEEEVPDRFKELLARLRAKESGK